MNVIKYCVSTCSGNYPYVSNLDGHVCIAMCPQNYGPVVGNVCSLCSSSNGGAYWIRSSGTCAVSCGALGLNATYSICESLTDYTNCDYSYINTITYCSSSCVTGYLFVSNLNSHLCITSCPQGFGPSGTPLTCTACANNWERDTATCVGASCPAGYG